MNSDKVRHLCGNRRKGTCSALGKVQELSGGSEYEK